MIAKLRKGFAEAWQEKVQSTKDFWTKGGWKEFLKRSLRGPQETPYWRKELERQASVETVTYEDTVYDWSHAVRVIWLGLFAAIGILTPMAYIDAIIFGYPGGVVRLIAEFLAQVCQVTGNCDFAYLMASLVFGTQILLVVLGLILIAALGGQVKESTTYTLDDDDDVSEHAQIDDRIVTLRDDLVNAGVLKAGAYEEEWQEGD